MSRRPLIKTTKPSRHLCCPGLRFSLLVALCFLSCFFASAVYAAEPAPSPGAGLEEAADFFQYTDDTGGIHFVDSIEKIPRGYRNRVIVRHDLPSARQTTKVLVVDGQIHLPVTLKIGARSVQAVMLLDTGASITCISEGLAARLKIDRDGARSATTRLADGRDVPIRLAQLDSVSVGTRVKAPLEIAIFQDNWSRERYDGLLGLDFLGQFQYQIDLANQLIRWQ